MDKTVISTALETGMKLLNESSMVKITLKIMRNNLIEVNVQIDKPKLVRSEAVHICFPLSATYAGFQNFCILSAADHINLWHLWEISKVFTVNPSRNVCRKFKTL